MLAHVSFRIPFPMLCFTSSTCNAWHSTRWREKLVVNPFNLAHTVEDLPHGFRVLQVGVGKLRESLPDQAHGVVAHLIR